MDDQIRQIKHAINIFNTTTIIPEFNITIDQTLVLIPQLTNRKDSLLLMSYRQPKVRNKASGSSNLIDYIYANYDINEIKETYNLISDKLHKAQLAFDYINNAKLIDIDI